MFARRNDFTLYGKHKFLHFWEYITPQEGICVFFINARLINFVVVVVVVVVVDDDDILPQVIWTI